MACYRRPPPWALVLLAEQQEIKEGIHRIMTDQSHIDQDVSAVESELSSFESTTDTAFTNLTSEIAALQQQPGAENLDFTGLDKVVTDVQSALTAATQSLSSAVTAAAPASSSTTTPAPDPTDPTSTDPTSTDPTATS